MRNKKEVTGSFKYKSILTGEYVLAHQWVAEVLVKRKSQREEKSLPDKFWLDSSSIWAKEFKKLVQQAAKLIKRYSEEALLNFMKNNPYNYSLFSKMSLDRIKKEHDIIVSRPVPKTIETEDANEYIKPKPRKKGLLSKLS